MILKTPFPLWQRISFWLILLAFHTLTPSVLAEQAHHHDNTHTLESLFDALKQNNAALAIQRQKLLASDADLESAHSLSYPNIDLNGVYEVAKSDDEFYDLNTTAVSVDLTQPIYQPQTNIYLQQTEKAKQIAQLQLKQVTQNLRLQLIESYFAALMAKHDLMISDSKLNADLRQYEKLKTTSEAGLSSKTDLLQASANLDLSRANKIRLKSTLASKTQALSTLVGIPVFSLKSLNHKQALPVTLINQNIEAAEHHQNLDLEIARISAIQAQHAIEFQRNENGLEAYLQASYGTHNFDNYPVEMAMQYQNRQTLRVSGNLSYPLYDGGSTKSKVAKAQHEYHQALQNIRQTEEQIQQSIFDKQTNLEQFAATITALQKVLASSKELLAATEVSYDAGLADFIEVLNAQTTRFDAESNLMETQYLFLQEQFALKTLLNQVSETDLRTFDNLFTETTELK